MHWILLTKPNCGRQIGGHVKPLRNGSSNKRQWAGKILTVRD